MAEVTERSRWELAAESTVVKLRWFGIVMGYILVQTRTGLHDPWAVRAFLALGAGYAALDLAFWLMGEVILKGWPLLVSFMESIFIALLCYHDTGLDSPFRWYYLLSLICCSIQNRSAVAWWTLGFHGVSLLSLSWVLGELHRPGSLPLLTLTIMTWVTWASSSLAGSLRAAGEELGRLNGELAGAHAELERRVEERTGALRASQAKVIQQEKMAAFGLLAAGIAHEVGNPLAALSSLVQMLQRRGPDEYTAGKLDLAGRQLQRIERTIRELVDFSRPASSRVTRVRMAEVVDEALGIAKYYQRTKQRSITTDFPADLPMVVAMRDYLIQVVLNLVLNAIDATEDQGRIHVEGRVEENWLVLSVEDDGRGISLADRCRLFQPFFTTKPHGTGLGLFVSRQILEDMSGQLAYRSEPGQGSTFVVRIPIEPAERNRSGDLNRPADVDSPDGASPSRVASPARITSPARIRREEEPVSR
jgi:signal transduction histidine kinase